MKLSDFWIGFICGGGCVVILWLAAWATKFVSSFVNDDPKYF